MGQYFKAVNLDKREVVCPWCLGGGAKLWEWAANPQGAIFTLLLRQSTGSGGGDYYGYRTMHLSVEQPEALHQALCAAATVEAQPIHALPDSIVGRWAGDRVTLVGDYDDSKLWDQLPAFRNVSAELVEAWNSFIDIPEMKLTFRADCSCQ